MPEPMTIRPAHPDDAELIFALVKELAEYERAPDEVTGNSSMLREALFGADPQCEVLIAELGGQPAGFALIYSTFSTWECRPGIWIEDLYVRKEHRGAGVGGALLARVAAIALERGCARLEWAALRWNTPALEFYERLTAKQLDEWVMFRLDSVQLQHVAAPGLNES